MKIQSGQDGSFVPQMAAHFGYVSSLQCDRQHLSHSFNFAATSENSHRTQHSTDIKSYLQYTTEIIEHTGIDSHFLCSLKLLMNFCFFFNKEYTIIMFTSLLFALPDKLELQWLDSFTRIETEKTPRFS